MFDDDDDEVFSVKLADTKSYIRLTDDGEPQLIRIVPIINEIGMIDPYQVVLYIDEEAPRVVPRFTIEPMLEATECVPLETVTHWKHKRVH